MKPPPATPEAGARSRGVRPCGGEGAEYTDPAMLGGDLSDGIKAFAPVGFPFRFTEGQPAAKDI